MDEHLIWALKNGDMGNLQDIIEKEGAVVNKEMNGRCPLHYAADYGQTEVINYLISKGAEINKPDKYGITPLLSAIFEDHPDCVKLLLEKGADKSLKGPNGESYVECAENDEMKKLLL